METMLNVKDLTAGYNKTLRVLNGITFSVQKGQIVALLGGNGVGKTTTLKSIVGLIHPWGGSVEYRGQEITHLPSYEVVKLGLAMVPEGRLLFGKLTVQENLTLGAFTRKDPKEISKSLEMVYDLFPRVKERAGQKANTLSGGEQQMVAIARGLMSKPDMLIFDEPSLGLAPVLVKEVFQFLKKISEQGITILIVEQNVKETLAMADYAHIIQDGKIIISGTPDQMTGNDDVRKAYLGI